MKLYFHPRSIYSHKVLLALFEKQVAFTSVIVKPGDAELARITPLGKVPVLVLDDGWKIPESSIIVEYLDSHHPTPRLIPAEPDQARQTRFHDRLADLYVNDSLLTIFFDGQKPEGKREPERVATAHQRLDTLFTGFDEHLSKGRTWVMGDAFTMADCALLPCLSVARMLHPFERHKHLTAYAGRGAERPSVQRLHAEMAPYLVKAGAA